MLDFSSDGWTIAIDTGFGPPVNPEDALKGSGELVTIRKFKPCFHKFKCMELQIFMEYNEHIITHLVGQ